MSKGFDYNTTLGTKWSKSEKCLHLYYPKKSDGRLLYDFTKSDEFLKFKNELEKRGYDF